jgi:hypothetical protein
MKNVGMLQSQKRASKCREIASKAFLAKIFSGLRAFGARATGFARRPIVP